MKTLSSPVTLIKKAVNLFAKKENLFFLVKVYLPLLPFSILSVAQSYIPQSIVEKNPVLFAVVMGILQPLSLLTSIFVGAAGIVALGKIISSGELSVKKTFGSAWKVYWKFLLLSLVIALIYLFGFVLLIIPGTIFVVWFAFSKFMMVEKGAKLKESLLNSKNLVKGYFWKVLGRLIVFGLFMILTQMALGIVPFGIGSVVSSLCGGLFLLPVYLLYKELQS
jgi:hypothetical protein